MRTIDRYILQELGIPFAQSLGALTFILMTREILRLVELLINKGVGLMPRSEERRVGKECRL